MEVNDDQALEHSSSLALSQRSSRVRRLRGRSLQHEADELESEDSSSAAEAKEEEIVGNRWQRSYNVGMSTTPPLPPIKIPLEHAAAWQDGWRAGWAQGATDEAECRKIHKRKLSEIEECIKVLDESVSEEDALQFLRKVFFPNTWDIIVWKVSRFVLRFRRTHTTRIWRP